MPDPVAPFISELIRAANETDRLTKAESARLLQRCAATLRDYRHQIDYSETPANDGGPNDVAHELSEMARLIDLFSAEEVSKTLLEAVATIKAARTLLEIKHEIEEEGGGGAA